VSIPLSPDQFEKKPNRYLPTVTVRLDKVDATQRYWDQAKVDDIAAKGVKETGITPIAGFVNGRYKLMDGHHRFAGAMQAGATRIKLKKVR